MILPTSVVIVLASYQYTRQPQAKDLISVLDCENIHVLQSSHFHIHQRTLARQVSGSCDAALLVECLHLILILSIEAL